MTDPRFASSDAKGRTYSIPDMPPLLSVTSIIGVIEKPALVNWSAKMSAERAVKQEDTWHAIQQEEGDDEAVKWIARRHRDYTSYRQTLGSAVHWACENHGNLLDPDVQSKLQWYYDKGVTEDEVMAHYRQYERFLAEVKPNILAKEVTVCHTEHLYAGTLDMVVEIDGKTCIGDIKTGSAYPTTALQLTAYLHATDSVNEDGTLTPFDYRPNRAFVLELKPRSYRIHWYRCDTYTFDAFIHAKTLKHWIDRGGVIGEEWR